MNKLFLSILRCPVSKEELFLDVTKEKENGCVEEGVLYTHGKKYTYPIIRGIPRFVKSDSYTKSFSKEWAKWANVQYENENVNSPMHNHTKSMFEKITLLDDDAFKGKLTVEFGCGGGRFIDVVRKKGGISIGIDLSTAVEQAGHNFKDDENVLIVQGDILNAPFKDGSFDIGYTMGVLHHTPEPYKGFVELARILKKQAVLICCVYPKNSYYDFRSVDRVRKSINKTEFLFGNKLALLYAHFSARILYPLLPRISKISEKSKKMVRYVEENFLPVLYIPDVKWRVLDVYDSITPKYASTHSKAEITSWFTKQGFTNIQKTNWGDSAFKGIK